MKKERFIQLLEENNISYEIRWKYIQIEDGEYWTRNNNNILTVFGSNEYFRETPLVALKKIKIQKEKK